MGKAEPLKDLLRRKKEHDEKDWAPERRAWLKSIESLYNDIESWLGPSKRENLISAHRRSITLRERLLGDYQINELVLTVGRSEVRFTPVARHVVGAFGRVDVHCAGDVVELVQMGDERGWCVRLGPDEPYLFPFDKGELTRLLQRLFEE